MNIQFDITEEEIREIAEDSVRKIIDETVQRLMNDEVRSQGYNRLLEAITPRMLDEVSKLVKAEEKYIIDRVAEKIARGLRISSSDIITALLAMSRESED